MSLEKNNLKQEASAALATAVIAIPGTLIFGMIAFAPLGQRYISFGILSGFVCAIVLGGFSGFFSPTKGLISGPRAGVSIAIASFLTFLSEGSMSLSPSYLLWLLFLTLLTAGFFQLLLGFFKMGIVIKYISYPVIVGLINSKVFLLLKGQFWNIIGIEKESTTLWGAFQRINPYSALVFVFTLVLYFLLKKFMKKIPVHIFVIISGTLLHHMLLASGITTDAGNALPAFQMDFSNIFYYLENSGFLDFRFAGDYAVEIIVAALGIAILSSTDTLLTSLAIQNITYDKVNGNRELLVQGLGNILTAFLGGIPGGGSFTRSMTNVHAGGRSRIAALGCAALLLLILTQLSEIIYYIPLSVIAGMVVLIAANMFDTWIIELFRKLWKRDGGFNALVLVNIAVVLLVFVITMITNLIYAALGGVIISMVLYVYRKSQSSILKKIYSGARIRSKKQRSTGMMELLSSHGHRIAIAELEGSIFFGTADELANQIDGLVKKEVKYIILDLKRITDIDASGVKILERVYNKSASRNCRMFFSYLSENSLFWEVFNEFSFFRGLGRAVFFEDSDSALEYCEELLLKDYRQMSGRDLQLRFEVFRNFNSADYEALKRLLFRKTFKKGEYVCRKDEESDSMYFIAKGTADITIPLANTKREKRLETLEPGTFFGEMALIEGRTRSANVRAHSDLVCLILKKKQYWEMKANHGETYMKMMINILKTISSRLRYANITISELES